MIQLDLNVLHLPSKLVLILRHPKNLKILEVAIISSCYIIHSEIAADYTFILKISFMLILIYVLIIYLNAKIG